MSVFSVLSHRDRGCGCGRGGWGGKGGGADGVSTGLRLWEEKVRALGNRVHTGLEGGGEFNEAQISHLGK